MKEMNVQILFEDNHIIAVNKPAGMLTQGDATGRTTLVNEVKSYIKVKYSKPGNVFLGMVHRLDRIVSGIVVFARTTKAAGRISQQIRDRTAEKYYIAVTHKNDPCRLHFGNASWNRIEHYLVRKKKPDPCI